MKTSIHSILRTLNKLPKTSRITKHLRMPKTTLHEMPTLQQLVLHKASNNRKLSNRWSDSDLKKFWSQPTTEQRLYRDRSKRHFLPARPRLFIFQKIPSLQRDQNTNSILLFFNHIVCYIDHPKMMKRRAGTIPDETWEKA